MAKLEGSAKEKRVQAKKNFDASIEKFNLHVKKLIRNKKKVYKTTLKIKILTQLKHL
jgi:hypothetical protein